MVAMLFSRLRDAVRGEIAMPEIQIPDRFEIVLRRSQTMRAAVEATVSDFSAWLSDSRVTFFPDYTDHGAAHVSAVLATAAELISDPAWDVVSPEDVAVLILAALLHDAALHLSKDGFDALIRGRWSERRIDCIDATTWPELWRDFLFRARRWDEARRRDVFGEVQGDLPLDSLVDPIERIDDLRQTDVALIGEFIREHHPRLAHEIAVFGVPGPHAEPIRPSSRFGDDRIALAGLVARSHGLPLRDLLPFLESRHHRREYQGVHAVFLMALLRIADYLQLQSERANPIVPRYKLVASLRSQFEHSIHRSITNITFREDDPEAIRIDAKPENVRAFLHIQELLANLQRELDVSWAVIGEIYGSDRQLWRLGLKLRRVRSNLDDPQALARKFAFYPARIEFSVAHAEILEHLVGPLYGNEPEVGIRELLQNALDAVRELDAWLARHPEHRGVPRLGQEGDVEIWLCNGDTEEDRFLKISDRGIGMTEDVVRDYFLRVGASYRNSPNWQREFARGADADLQCEPRVLRSGRFGVGVMAAFLLGTEIRVSTRHIAADHGFNFRAAPATGPLELWRDETLAVGTTIEIPLRKLHISDDAWDWYFFAYPRVLRFHGKDRQLLSHDVTLPDKPESLTVGWYEAEASDFAGVFVGVSDRRMRAGRPLKGSRFVCNGIEVRDRFRSGDYGFSTRGLHELNLTQPSVVVLDADGRLPLDLKRERLVRPLPFAAEVERIACESVLAGMLLNLPKGPPVAASLDYLLPRFDRSMELMVSLSPWLLTPKGVTLLDGGCISDLGTDAILVTFSEGLMIPNQHQAVVRGSFIYGEDNELESLLFAGVIDPLEVRGTRLLVTKEYGAHLLELAQKKSILGDFAPAPETTDGIWTVLVSGTCGETRLDLTRLPKPGRRSGTWPVAVEWFVGEKQTKRRRSPEAAPSGLIRFWKEIIAHPVIPYDLEERRATLAGAYERLGRYFPEHEQDSRSPVGAAPGSTRLRRQGPSR